MFMIWQVGVKGSLERSGDLTSRTVVVRWRGDHGGTFSQWMVEGRCVGFDWLSLENGWKGKGRKQEDKRGVFWTVFRPEMMVAQGYSCQI